MTLTRACPACASSTTQAPLFSKNDCLVLRCAACGLGRAEAEGFDPAELYTGRYFDGGHVDGYGDYHASEAVIRREFASIIARIRRMKPSGRLFDIGCAYGYLLKEAAPYFAATGIEISDEAADVGRAEGLNIRTGRADIDTMAELGTFDVITMLDVMEHLERPSETLALCTRHLNRGGVMVITTGDFNSLYARLAGARWRLMTPPSIFGSSPEPASSASPREPGCRRCPLPVPGRLFPCR